MPLINSFSQSDDKKIQEMKAHKAELDKSIKEFTKLQDIQKLRVQAERQLADANIQAEKIISEASQNAERYKVEEQKTRDMQKNLQDLISKAEKDAIEAGNLKAASNKQYQENLRVKSDLASEIAECQKSKAYLKDRIEHLKTYLGQFGGSIN